MKTKEQGKNIFEFIVSAFQALFQHKEILFPFCIIAFFQFLFLEIFYFSFHSPLSLFFGPLIGKLTSPIYMQYPLNFVLIPKMFQKVQPGIYVLISSFCVALAVAIIVTINNDKKVNLKTIFKEILSRYVHLIFGALIAYGCVELFFFLYKFVLQRAVMIRSTSGIYFMIKQFVIIGTPYFHLLLSVLVTTLFAYVIPVIVIEKRKIFSAIGLNFKYLFGSFWFTFFLVLIPSLLYVPVILLRSILTMQNFFPEITLIMLALSVIVMVFIDAIIYTAITMFYLLKREES